MRITGNVGALALALGVVAEARGQPRPAPPPVAANREARLRIDTGYVRITGGRLHYEAAGTGPAIVLLHSGNLDSRSWDPQFLAFANGHRVVRYDARGLGRSSPADVPYAAHDDLLALLDTLHIARASLVGLSGGVRIAIDFALAHPSRVNRLVLASPGLSGWRFREIGDTSWAAAWRSAAARQDSVGMAVSWLSSDWMKPAMEHPELRARLHEWILAGAGNWIGLVRHGDLERVANPPARGRTRLLKAPTLVIVGSRDLPEIHHIVDTLVATVPDVRRVTFVGSGHMVNLEQAQRFTTLVSTFLDSATWKLAAQTPVACYSLSYEPESLAAYVPVRIDLYGRKYRPSPLDDQHTDRFVARWQALPGARGVRNLFQHSRGYAGWRPHRDSLALMITGSLAPSPFWYADLGPLLHGAREGTVGWGDDGSAEPGTVRAVRTPCSLSG